MVNRCFFKYRPIPITQADKYRLSDVLDLNPLMTTHFNTIEQAKRSLYLASYSV